MQRVDTSEETIKLYTDELNSASTTKNELVKNYENLIESMRNDVSRLSKSLREIQKQQVNSDELDTKLAEDTLNILLKHQQDIEVVKKEIPALVSSATETSDGKSLN